MKRNLNSLKKLISQFSPEKYHRLTKEQRLYLLDEILFFQNTKETAPFINDKTKRIELVKARSAQHQIAIRTYKPGTTFIRARKVRAVLEKPILQDFWEPPLRYTRKGRLNQTEESVLYVTCDTLTAKKETHIRQNDIYNLSFYRAADPITVTEIGFPQKGEKTIIKKTIDKFFHDLFMRQGEAIYDISNFIAKRYFDLSEGGWVYPSVANNYQGENICFNIKSKQKLSLIGAFAFCNNIPIVNYDLADQNAIKASTPTETAQLWHDFTNDPKNLGKISATHDPNSIYMVKQLHHLNL